jgi:N-formylglutamate deformylase
VPIALATDHNPGTSPTLSPLLMMNMACTLFRLTPEEALAGFTRHAARALGLHAHLGQLTPAARPTGPTGRWTIRTNWPTVSATARSAASCGPASLSRRFLHERHRPRPRPGDRDLHPLARHRPAAGERAARRHRHPGRSASGLRARALATEDADWHLEKLYAFVCERGASLIVPRFARYVIDLNRPPDNAPMYPGANNTELCPTRFFSGEPLYREGQAPDAAEVQRRRARYWQPYHDALGAELARLQAAHGHAVLFDGHSIRSELPWLFEGKLPDLNLGTVGGSSCDPLLRQRLAEVLAGQDACTQVVDGRFKGGHITRHYGQPAQGRHAIQLEMCWSCYMTEAPPWAWDAAHAAQVQPLLARLVDTMLAWRPEATA